MELYSFLDEVIIVENFCVILLRYFVKSSLIIPDSENKDENDVRNLFNINENQYKELLGIVSQIKQTLLFKPDE